MKVEWYVRTGLGRLNEIRGTTEGQTTVDVLRGVLAEHGAALMEKPFAGISLHAMPAESEHSFDNPKGGPEA